jgi:hypothetical protein
MEIELSNGYTTLVDEEDWISQKLFLLPWYAARQTGGRIYVITKFSDPKTGVQRTPRLHSEVMDAPPGFEVDHRAGPGLDNRRANLRVCMNAQNQQNTGGRGGTSRFKGVGSNANQGQVDRPDQRGREGVVRRIFFRRGGRRDDELARLHHGQFARLNGA